MKARITGVIACLLVSAPSFAQEISSADEFFDDTPIILTASRMIKPKHESPASVTVINRDMIEGSGARDLADLFRLVPGFVVGFSLGHQPVVTYHGLGWAFARELQVLIDGRSVFIPSFGGIPWSSLPVQIEDIERIEVIRGPNSVTFGANAFLATINIITRSAAEDRGIGYSVSSSAGSGMDVQDVYARASNSFGELDWRLSVGRKQDDGSEDVDDDKTKEIINLRFDYTPTNSQVWMLQLGQNDAQLQRGEPREDLEDTDITRDETAVNRFVNLQWENRWNESSSTLVKYFSSTHDVTDNYALDQVAFPPLTGSVVIDFDRLSERSDLEIIQNQDIGDNLRLVYGGGLREERVKSFYLFNTRDYLEVDTERLFASLEWRANDDWLLDFGLMAEDSTLTDQNISPRLSLIHKLSDQHSLRWVSSRAYRNPILWETDGETTFQLNDIPDFPVPPGLPDVVATVPFLTSGGDLHPERIDASEIGLRSRLARHNLETDVKLFSYRISDTILFTDVATDFDQSANIEFTSEGNPIPGLPDVPVDVSSNVNDESVRVDGIELEFRQQPVDRVSLFGGFSFVNASSDNEKLEETFPSSTAFISAGYQINDRNQANLSLYHINGLSWLDTSDDVPANNRIDFRYLHRLTNGIRLEVIMQNLQGDSADYRDDEDRVPTLFFTLSGEL